METIKKLETILAWCASLSCIAVALFFAIEHTADFFTNHNYFFSPFADDILDSALFSYPIATGKASIWHVFDPYIDHRVAVEHIQEVIDFVFTNGVQTLQPYRISILLWLNFFIFSRFVIYTNENITQPVKLLLSGAYLILIFPGMSVNNYVSTMQLTWPVIFLFSLLTVISLAKYCDLVESSTAPKKAYLYIAMTVLCLNVVLYTFNIGVILWPIIFFILYKKNCFRYHRFAWLSLALLNFYCYVQKDWVSANFHSYTHQTTGGSFFSRPLEAYFYFSRIISVPFDSAAFNSCSALSAVVGILATVLSLAIIGYFLRKKTWTLSESVFVGYYLFALLSLAVITIMRSNSGKFTIVEWRFLTAGLIFLFCLLMSIFFLPIVSSRYKTLLHSILSVIACVWLIIFFIPADSKISGGTYDLGFYNQVYISEAIGIPINEDFLKSSKIYQTCGTLAPHVTVNETQKVYKKGPYSFWASQVIDRSISELSLKKMTAEKLADIKIVYDYRPNNSSGLLLNVKLDNYVGTINENWQVLFTNSNGKIIGFAISAPYLQPLWTRLTLNKNPLLWRGAINTITLHSGDKIQAWVASPQKKMMYNLGTLEIPSPLVAQAEPTWVWQKTLHFGI